MDLNYDVYEGQSQPVTEEVIIGYAQQYFSDYIGTQVTINDDDGNEIGQYDFLPFLLAVINGESNSDLYTASNVDADQNGILEASFGLFQINWETESGTISHAPTIVDKMIKAGVISAAEKGTYLQNLDRLTDEQVQTVVQFMSQIDVQFELASEIYKSRKQFPEGSNGDFQDWGARNAGGTIQSYDNYKLTVDNLLQNPQAITDAMAQFNPTPIKFKEKLGILGFDDPNMPMAAVGETQSQNVSADEQLLFLWNQTSTLIDRSQGFDDNQFMGFINKYFNADKLTQDDKKELYENNIFTPNALSVVRSLTVQADYNRTAGSAAWRNPFLLSSQTGEPTLANAILAEVYRVFELSADANGVQDANYMAVAHLLPQYDALLRGVQSYLDSTGNIQPGYQLKDVVNDLAHLAGRNWQFGKLPDYGNPEELYDKNQLRNSATSLVQRILLDNNPSFVNKVTEDYTDYLIANPNAKIDFNTFAYNAIKNTSRYKGIYKNKPTGLTEDQFLNIYSNASQAASPAEQDDIIISQAMAGGTAETAAQVAQFTESGTRSNSFVNGMEQTSEGLAKLLRRT
ncbi:MAG: hypothetical protein CMQ02_09735 [Gammaproteobacteria bacterium]|nr:hypothetical protein [Gammaproteobacteria bacterium]|tara:strand:+ start:1975 stop:3690 length:1716 start_codon:yes stop_codon:yes gene_type:complete